MTETRDLGRFDAPVLVFGGPYSNLEATRALLAEAARRDIPPRNTLCTGDVVAYCADPQATVDLLREAGITVLMGNCEENLGNEADACGCGFTEGSSCDFLSAQWFGYAAAALDAGAKAWMRGLPRRLDFTIGGARLAVVHGGVDRINRFVFPSTPTDVKVEELNRAGVDGVVAGHCGVPFTEVVDGRLWHNAGVIGVPANDGTPRVWYAVLRAERDGVVIEHHALAYDQATAAARMRGRGLPEAYAQALETGLWPADDVMPAADRERRGRPLAEHSVLWQPGAD